MEGELVIDWASMPTYNTIMAVAAGAGLILLVQFGRELLKDPASVTPDGWALGFGVPGVVLTSTGFHMTVTWPLAEGGFPFDNIIFGETSLGFGVLLLAAAFYLWRRGREVMVGPEAITHLKKVAKPVSISVLGMGLGLLGLAVAGVRYQLFAAPPQEPISGTFADYPLVEAIFISGLLALVGVGAALFPLALRDGAVVVRKIIGWFWGIAGVALLLFGALNFFTHIGLIVNTMG